MKVVVLLLFIFIGYLEAFLQRSNFGLKSFSTSKLQAVQITVKPEEPVESILRRFKKAVNKQGYLWELRYKDAHETSLEKLKRKKMRLHFMKRLERGNEDYLRKIQGHTEVEYNT